MQLLLIVFVLYLIAKANNASLVASTSISTNTASGSVAIVDQRGTPISIPIDDGIPLVFSGSTGSPQQSGSPVPPSNDSQSIGGILSSIIFKRPTDPITPAPQFPIPQASPVRVYRPFPVSNLSNAADNTL